MRRMQMNSRSGACLHVVRCSLVSVILLAAPLGVAAADTAPLDEARALLRQANLAEERASWALVEKALAILTPLEKPAAEVQALRRICRTYLTATQAFWQADRHQGSEQAERLLRDFQAETGNPLFLQALLYQGRYHYWKAVEGNYPQGHDISKKMFEKILRHNPQHRLARIYLGQPVAPRPAALKQPTGKAPEWAVAAREAMYWTRRVVHWWLDNRQAPDGQLGGGWSDDVEYSKTWSFYSLALGDDKVRRSLTRIADNIWHCPDVANGYYAGTPKHWHLVDVEHGAEWMSFSQPQMMLARYGDPRYIERNMQVIRNMDLLTGVNAAGHRHFKAYYFSHDLLHPRRLYQCDVPENGRYTKPGIYVMWYAQHPRVMQWCREWGDAWVDHSLAAMQGKPAGFIPSEVVYESDQVGGMSGKWYRIAGYPGYDFASGSWSTKHLMGQLIANAKLFDAPRYVEPLRRIVEWKQAHRDAPYGPEGSDGWILRKEYTAEKMWSTWKRIRDGWQAPADLAPLVKELREISAFHAATWEMNTQEVISTDRVPLQAKPSSVLMNMYTGGWGSMQAYYPDSAVSWENVELQVVPLVLEADHRHLKILLHNFDEQPRTVTMRPLELDTGVYDVQIATQQCAPFHLTHRFEPLQLSLPPQATSLVEVRQLTARPLPGPLPDLALSETECLLQRSRDTALLRVRLHNVGIRDSGPAMVTFTALTDSGPREIGSQAVGNLSWPQDLMPAYVTVDQPWRIDEDVRSVRVEVSIAEPDEICVENNRVEVPLEDWIAPQDFRERANLYGVPGSEIPRPAWPVARCASPPGSELPDAPGFAGVSRVFGPFREAGNLQFPVRYGARQSLAWLLRDETNLYVLVSSWKSGDALRRQVQAGVNGSVENLRTDDCLELRFQPPGQPWRSLQLNANGATRGQTADGKVWSPLVRSVHKMDPSDWCAEWWCRIEIPLQSLGVVEELTGQQWRFDIVRHGFTAGRPESSSWSGGVLEKPQTWGLITW